MTYNPNIHHRRSIRLKGYDYSQAGLYFITICCQDRAHLFGKIINGEMILNDAGKMIVNEWMALRDRFPNIELHEFIVMPNHFHSIMQIVDTVGAPLVGALNDTRAQNNAGAQNDRHAPNNLCSPNDLVTANDAEKNDKGRPQGHAPTKHGKTVGDILDAFKSITTVKYIHGVKQSGWEHFNGKLWHRNYYEHIIRNEQQYQRISDYIIDNPAKWKDDKFYNA
jgi:putative transposase